MSWPPQFGQVAWTRETQSRLYSSYLNVSREGGLTDRGEDELSMIGSFVGDILVQNIPDDHLIPGKDMEFTVPRIAVELTQGWSAEARLLFMRSVVEGAGIISPFEEYNCLT